MLIWDAYLRVLDWLGFGASFSLLLYAEEVLDAEHYSAVEAYVFQACLTLPYLADAVDKMATYIGVGRRAVRWLVTGRVMVE
jgi:hypothetical protein